MRIIRRIDQARRHDVEIMPLQNASAAEVVRVVNTLLPQQPARRKAADQPSRVIADDRSNSVLIGGDKTQRLRIKALIAHLDTPLESGGDTQVRYLQFADAEKIATKLKEQIRPRSPSPPGARRRAAPRQSGVAASSDRSTTIWAEPETNALVITAPAKIMKLADGGRRQARHPPHAGADRGHHRRRQREQERRARRELGRLVRGSDTRIPVGSFISPWAA